MTKHDPPHRRVSPSPRTRAKIARALRGCLRSEETREKMSAARAAYYAGEEGAKRREAVGKRNRAYHRRVRTEAAE